MSKPTAKYIWIDIETTGLEPGDSITLELAAWVGGGGFLLMEDQPQIERVFHCSKYQRDRADDFVEKMHAANGLWDEAMRSAVLRRNIDLELVALVDRYDWADGKPIIAGSSVHFDRRFLRLDFPKFEATLHHRHFDVSSLKMAAIDAVPGLDFPGEAAHRAAADILESRRHGARAVEALAGRLGR